MSSGDNSAFEAFQRTVIMLGTLIVGCLAWAVYGPPPERLGPAIDEVAIWLKHAVGAEGAVDDEALRPVPTEDSALAMESALAPLAASTLAPLSAPSAPAAPSSTLVDPQVAPASYESQGLAPAPTPWPTPADTVPAPDAATNIKVQLEAAGARDVAVAPWGGEGRFYRCSCWAPMGPGGMARQFDAIEATPNAAAARVLTLLQEAGGATTAALPGDPFANRY